ncbi:MAG: KTSC domain-containing protein [Propionibacteriales bacterium]|nr:KTSC domain-containing protein [Propionibacteriales bacterium]
MKREPVTSAALRSVGYDPETWTLEVEFVSGDVYQYLEVEPEDVEALIRSGSMGRFLNQHIKPRYQYVDLGRG